MKHANILSIPFLVVGLIGAASASSHDPYDPFSLGKGPYPSVGQEVWTFVSPSKAPSNTRARVVAELREAQRLGLVNAGGEGNIPVATAEQERLIALAGARAAGQPTMATR